MVVLSLAFNNKSRFLVLHVTSWTASHSCFFCVCVCMEQKNLHGQLSPFLYLPAPCPRSSFLLTPAFWNCPFMSACTLTVTKLLLTPVFWNLSLYVCFYPDQASVDTWLLKPVPLCLPVPWPWPAFCWHPSSEAVPLCLPVYLYPDQPSVDTCLLNLSLYVCLYPDRDLPPVDTCLLKPVTLCLPVPWPNFCLDCLC